MTDRETLIALAARVEKTTGPDRELDRAIMEALSLAPDYAADWGPRYDCRPAPFAYTASIDAALALVPDGCWAEGSLASPAALEIHAPMTFDPLGKGWAATPALALTAAALRALASQDGRADR